MDEIILIGAGGHARSCIDVIEMSGQFKVAGFVEKEGMNNNASEYPILGTDDNLYLLRKKYRNALITIGQIKSPETRIKLFQLLKEMNYTLPKIQSPTAYVSKKSNIESGTIIMHGVIINTNAKIGNNCIINNSALVEHDALIGDHCHISTGAIINGEVTVGRGSFIGSGAVTKQSISIGSNCVIGAGAIIKSDIQSNQIIFK